MDGLVWLVGLLAVLAWLQRRLHFETQAIFLLITRRSELALALYSLLFFPGVLIHETSHFLVARLLGVRTGRFSLVPQPLPDGRLQLGYVETASTDVAREALIGSSPLLAGGAFVAYAALGPLGLPLLWGDPGRLELEALWEALASLPARPDFWLWFYLAFTVSSTMLPSASDRRAWLPIALAAVLFVGVAALVGAGPWLLRNLIPHARKAWLAIDALLAFCVLLHLALLPPAWALRRLLGRWSGLRVQNHS